MLLFFNKFKLQLLRIKERVGSFIERKGIEGKKRKEKRGSKA